MKPLSIYIHIPFCVKKCVYCDFLSFDGMESAFKRYTEVLSREIMEGSEKFDSYMVNTIFFGGGTPTVLNAEQTAGILRIIKERFNISVNPEITIEANPGTVNEQNLFVLRDCGFNRISFGLQSNNNRLLRVLGRIHDCKTFERNFEAARKAGFRNINIDLMHSLPHQSEKDWEETLNFVISKKPEHISAYGLILEEGTALFKLVNDEALTLPDEETQLAMCRIAENLLEDAGYKRYEISNFARHGFLCRHNITYWRCDEYVGFGLGASSCIGFVRSRNEADLGKYLAGGFRKYDVQELSFNDRVSEFMFLGLRMTEGVSQSEFITRFGKSPGEIYGEKLIYLINSGLIGQANDMIYLTERGIDISNRVFAELLL